MHIKELNEEQLENLYMGIVDESIFDNYTHTGFNEIFGGGHMKSDENVDGNYYSEIFDTHYPNLDYIYSDDAEVIFHEFALNYEEPDDIAVLDYDFVRIVNNNLFFAIK